MSKQIAPSSFYAKSRAKANCMDSDIVVRNGARQLILLPDADISEPENDSESDTERGIIDSDFNGSDSTSSDDSDSDEDPSPSKLRDPCISSNSKPRPRNAGDIPSTSNASSSSSADTPAKAATKATPAKTRGNFKWEKNAKNAAAIDLSFDEEIEFPADYYSPILKRPVWYFDQYFSPELIDEIKTQTNMYASGEQSTFSTTNQEVETYLGILIRMGLTGMTRFSMYWSSEFRLPAVADYMSRNRFYEMGRYLHFADNTKIGS